jgi:hypothetical protein
VCQVVAFIVVNCQTKAALDLHSNNSDTVMGVGGHASREDVGHAS